MLERYASRFNAVEINTSFYRPHKPETYARWASSVPTGFRFAVKAPRTVTHEARLKDCERLMERFLSEVGCLGARLGPVLVQLPPSLVFDAAVAEGFFGALRAALPGAVVCEPRHATWFGAEAEALLLTHRIARAGVDPAPHPSAARPAGWAGVRYWRLHGSPRMYYSSYPPETLRTLARRPASQPDAETWCVFDNTASGAAAANALALDDILRASAAA